MSDSKKDHKEKKFKKIHFIFIAGIVLVAIAFASYYAFPVVPVEFKIGDKIAPDKIEYIVKNLSGTRIITISCKNISSSPQNVSANFWITDKDGAKFDPLDYSPGTTFSDDLQPDNSGIITLSFDTPTILTEKSMEYVLHIKEGKEVTVPLK